MSHKFYLAPMETVQVYEYILFLPDKTGNGGLLRGDCALLSPDHLLEDGDGLLLGSNHLLKGGVGHQELWPLTKSHVDLYRGLRATGIYSLTIILYFADIIRLSFIYHC